MIITIYNNNNYYHIYYDSIIVVADLRLPACQWKPQLKSSVTSWSSSSEATEHCIKYKYKYIYLNMQIQTLSTIQNNLSQVCRGSSKAIEHWTTKPWEVQILTNYIYNTGKYKVIWHEFATARQKNCVRITNIKACVCDLPNFFALHSTTRRPNHLFGLGGLCQPPV